VLVSVCANDAGTASDSIVIASIASRFIAFRISLFPLANLAG
jgi:hypothetical protein